MLRTKNLRFNYPGIKEPALTDVSLKVGKGEVVAVTGPIGAGKTSLCMAIAGLVPRITGGKLTGELEVAGLDPRKASTQELAQKVGLVLEDYSAQLTQVKVLDEVMAPLLNRGVHPNEAHPRARELLELLGLGDRTVHKKRTWELSGGQKQRIAIAATLSMEPDLVIFDNPTTMLDPAGRSAIETLIAELAGKHTLIVVDTDLDFLNIVADRLVLLNGGEIMSDGPPHEALRDESLLEKAGVEPPITVRLAADLGLEGRPLSFDEFVRSVGSVSHEQQETRLTDTGSRAAVLEAEGVSYAYSDGTQALSDVSIQVSRGEVHALLGGNGAGKSTLTQLLIGLLTPTSGRLRIGGEDTSGYSVADLASRIGTAFQNPDEQISERTVADELAFPLQKRRYERNGWFSKRERYGQDHIDERVEAARELVGLEEDMLSQDPSLLPFGQRRLVSLAQSTALDPEAFVFDEPMGGLDADGRRRARQLVWRLKEMEKAIVLVEHDVDFVVEVADTVTVLEHGKVVRQGPPREVFRADDWQLLDRLNISPPRAAQLAAVLDLNVLSYTGLRAVLGGVKEAQ